MLYSMLTLNLRIFILTSLSHCQVHVLGLLGFSSAQFFFFSHYCILFQPIGTVVDEQKIAVYLRGSLLVTLITFNFWKIYFVL